MTNKAGPCSPSLLPQRELCSIPGANRKPLLSQGTLGWSLQTKYHPATWWEQVPHPLSAMCQPRWVLEKPWAEQQCGGGVSKKAALHSLGCFLENPFSIRTWMAMALDPALILELQSQVKGASFNTAASIEPEARSHDAARRTGGPSAAQSTARLLFDMREVGGVE